MAKSYRNKPNRDKRNRTRKEKHVEIREVPHYVWANLKIENMPLGKIDPYRVNAKTLHSIGQNVIRD